MVGSISCLEFDLIAEFVPMISSSDVSNFNFVEYCKIDPCGGMGAAQLAWCAHHIDLCPLVREAAAKARQASMDLIKGEGRKEAQRNALSAPRG